MESAVAPFSREHIKKHISDNYAIAVREIRPLSGGVMSDVYACVTDVGSLVFKSYVAKEFDGVADEVALLRELARLEFLSPRPIATTNGDFVLSFQSRSSALFSYIEGEITDELTTPAQLYEIGVLLGRLHVLLQDFSGRLEQGVWDPVALEKLVIKHGSEVRKRYEGGSRLVEFVESELPRYRFPSGLPSGVTHQDVKPENLIWAHGKVSGLVDFGNAYRGVLLFDVTTPIIWTCFPAGKFRHDLARALIEGYECVRPFTELERRVIPSAIRWRLLREVFIGPYATPHFSEAVGKRSQFFWDAYLQNPHVILD